MGIVEIYYTKFDGQIGRKRAESHVVQFKACGVKFSHMQQLEADRADECTKSVLPHHLRLKTVESEMSRVILAK